jgi:hypothetical protein
MSFHISEHVPDGIKVTASLSAPALTVAGVPLEEWTFILSAIVSILFIIEKMPMLINRVKQLYMKIKKYVSKE